MGKRITGDGTQSLLTLAQEAGISLTAVCGGAGVCGACKVRCVNGQLSESHNSESELFSETQIGQGWRLACMAYPLSDVRVEIPPESMTTTQRLQIEGVLREVPFKPAMQLRKFTLTEPNPDDLRADWERFTAAMGNNFSQRQDLQLPVLTQLSDRMRAGNWPGVAVFDEDQAVVGFLEADQNPCGVAVDIGTTKMAAFLVDLSTGETLGKMGVMNPQISYGEDVISRIAYANQGPTFRETLQASLAQGINDLVDNLCLSVGVEQTQIVDFVLVGNTAMHHLFAGLPVRQLGQAPYVAAVSQALRVPAHELSLVGAPGARIYLPPNIAGYVGGDHIAMLLASNVRQGDGVIVALDIGTNTEISLSKGGKLISCSCASGPAFEGAHIHAGMRAVPGAIERARFYEGDWHISTIDDEPPIGLCGSGILDVVAELLVSGQIDTTGRFTTQAIRRVHQGRSDAVVLVPGTNSGTGKDILVTQADIREIQLAKAAIRAGVAALLRATGTKENAIDQFIIAGAFGTYLNLESALKIGMFPELPRERYQQVGNAAGVGAQQLLVSVDSRRQAEAILADVDYLELTTDPGFMASYVDVMGFDPIRKE